MKMLKQIKKQEDLIGKTIAQVIIPKEHYDNVWMKFTDGSFVVFDVMDVSLGFENSKYLMCIDKFDVNDTDDELVELGLFTDQDHKDALERERIATEKRHEEYERQEKERIKKYELEQLEKLKKKYD